jgi:hypothetical protein
MLRYALIRVQILSEMQALLSVAQEYSEYPANALIALYTFVVLES